MKAALAQLNSAADLERDCETACATIESLSGSDMVLFPELFLGGYVTDAPETVATNAEGHEFEALGQACARSGTAAILGFTEQLGDGGFGNSAACFAADGKLAGIYRKANLFGAAERTAFREGDSMTVVRIADRLVGPQICFDVEFPEPSRLMARAGADLLATISANMEPYAADHRLAARARALDNRLPHLYVNRVGTHAGLTFTGQSCVIAADGTVIAELAREEEVLEWDVEAISTSTETSYLELLRPDLDVNVQHNANGGEA